MPPIHMTRLADEFPPHSGLRAAVLRVSAASFCGSWGTVIACRSTTQKNVSWLSCSATQLRIAPSQLPRCREPVG